jgi:hypothetical protein
LPRGLLKKPPLDFLLSTALLFTPRCFRYTATDAKMAWLQRRAMEGGREGIKREEEEKYNVHFHQHNI